MTDLTELPPAAVPPDASACPTVIRTYTGAAGRRLRMQVVEAKPARHQLLYVHGIESHSGWFLPAALLLQQRGCTTFLLDRRGSGLNRDEAPGDAASAAVLLEDVRCARRSLGDPPLHLVGLSWGGKLATAVALDQPDDVASLILLVPGLRARVDLSLRHKLMVALSLLVGGTGHVPVPIRPELFTRQPRLLDFIRHDPLRVQSVTARLLFASLRLDQRIRRRLPELRAAVLLLLAERDEIVDNDGVLRLLAVLPAGQLTVRRYAQAMHSIQLERTAAMVDDMIAFLDAPGRPW